MDQHIQWRRPREYLQQIATLMDLRSQREAKKTVFKPRRSSTKLVTALVGVGEEAKEASNRELSSQAAGSELKRIVSA